MKVTYLFLPMLFVAALLTAQDRPVTPLDTDPLEEEQEEVIKGFNPNRVFVGGSIGLGLGFGSVNSNWSIGGFPQIGYSLTNWLDAGVVFNANYNSQKFDYGNFVEKYTSFNYGTGAFVRAFPFKSFFVQAQPEFNWIKYKIASTGSPVEKTTVNAPSLLLGVGFGQRVVGQSGFFTTIMIDVGGDENSPYLNFGNRGIIPILRGGFYVYLGKR